MTIDTLLSADEGDAAGLAAVGDGAAGLPAALRSGATWPRSAGADAAYARRFFAGHRDRGSIIGNPGTDFIWAGGRLLDAWPASPDEDEYTTVRDSNVETLLVGGALDFATPPQNATRELLPHLPNGHQVVLPASATPTTSGRYQPEPGRG